MDKKLLIEMAKDNLLGYAVYCDKFFEVQPHHELIADYLKKLVNGDIQNLIISMPPRAGKSRLMQEFISKLYGDFPRTDILYTGHSLNLLEGFSRNIRNRIQTREYQSLYDTKISGDSGAVKNWNVEGGGEFAIYGVGGGITGKGGNYLIIDDPYASRQDAESDTVRRTVSNWYWSTLLTRKQNDKAKQILIMQRWREDDLAGEILEREPEKWTELKIPALNEKGESFWASKFSKEYFEDLRRSNPLFFESQYQQNPINSENGDFVRSYFTYYKDMELQPIKKYLSIVTFVDPAISQNQEADNTAIVTAGIDTRSNFIYVLEVEADKMLPDEIIDKTFARHRKWGGKVGVENIAYQKMLILEMQKQMRIRNYFFTLEEVRPNTEKNAKIRTLLQPRYASHSVLHSVHMQELEAELLKFPNGKHDDRCLVGDTMIKVKGGDKKIKDVKVGDYVLTRKGYKKVLVSGCTGLSEVITNAGITGTYNHPVITKKGVKLLANVSESDILYIWNDKQSSIIEQSIIDTQNQRENNTLTTSGLTQKINRVLSHFIDKCGLMNIEKYRKGIIYTIKTAISGIIQLIISSVYRIANTLLCIGQKKGENNNQKQLSKTMQKCKKQQKNGEQVKNEKNGTHNTQKTAVIDQEKYNVLSVAKNVSSILQTLCVAVKESVVSKKTEGYIGIRKRVYNLKIEGEAEYFANGVLVHNCDALSGCIQLFSTSTLDDNQTWESSSFL